eukprot:scaffold9503_cov72-Cylindrotheca_fusiformis.AAC.1
MMVPQQSSAEIDGRSHEDRPILLTKDGLMLTNFIIEGKRKYSEVVVWDRSYFLGSNDGSTTIIRSQLKARESIPRSSFAIDEAGMVVGNNRPARIEGTSQGSTYSVDKGW